MNAGDALDRLAELGHKLGIAASYHDIWGNEHHTSAATLRALIDAFGAVPKDESSRVLPPVLIAREEDGAAKIPIAPVDFDTAWRWRIIEENGAQHSGSFIPSELSRDAQGRAIFDLAPPLAIGYHTFELSRDDEPARMPLIVVPAKCYWPPALAARVWGPALQLYAVRSERNWGIGDFTDLKNAVEIFAREGAGVVGVNPLCALFPHDPRHASPYSPSNRSFLNFLYLDVDAIIAAQDCEVARAFVRHPQFLMRLAKLRGSDLVDYEAVAAAKFEALEILWRHFREKHLTSASAQARAFRAYQAAGGRTLYTHALFTALQEHFHGADPALWGWPKWPEEYRDPESSAVVEFRARNRDRVEFYQYLQWCADRQLDEVGKRCLALRMGVGLYLDLPISVDAAGAGTWANQNVYALSARVGAPPDEWNPRGQDWGLPPFNPRALREAAYAPWIAVLRSTMRHAGALRIDHVMGLMRLYWVPPNASAKEGAYVHYLFEDLLGILALESQRNRCLVIGEDLGTVPDEVRAGLHGAGLLSYRLLYFEKNDNDEFKSPDQYPAQALCTISTHDLPTLAGYWEGRDLAIRNELNLFPSDALREQAILVRSQERARLLLALEREGLLPEAASIDPASVPAMTAALSNACHRFLARTPAKVMMVQLEDVMGTAEQVNMPGTVGQQPNWRKKLPLNLERLTEERGFREIVTALREERGSPSAAAARTEREIRLDEVEIPNATYRLQLNRDFTFNDAAKLVPYLARLGISHCYASPYLKARPGSTHGYDIIDHSSLNPEIGGMDAFEDFVAALEKHGMGHILDLVPNHMGVMGADNAWWLDVLENGQSSVYANFFDIDWEPLKEDLRGKVLLPVLGDRYGAVLEQGELRLAFDRILGSFSVFYYEHRLPIGPRQYAKLLSHRLPRLEARAGKTSDTALRLQSLITAFEHLPARREILPEKIAERDRDKELHKQRLARLCREAPEVLRVIEETVLQYNGVPGYPDSFELLHELLEAQAYRLADWRVARDEINYRRFFDINDLAALRMELPEVFNATHGFVLDLVAQGKIAGLRIDHPDGLYDPATYYAKLQSEIAKRSDSPGTYLCVEKILATHERLPEGWLTHGTTGYDFANLVNGLFVRPEAEPLLTRFYHAFIGEKRNFDDLLYECKKLIVKAALASEVNVLAYALDRIAELDRHTRDFTLNQLRDALTEVIACFPVYRTYVREGDISESDRRHIAWAIGCAKKKALSGDLSAYDFIRDVLLLDGIADKSDQHREAIVRFAMKFPQVTSPVMAKGLEDTALYRDFRLASLNDVGGDPRRFFVSVAAFHNENLERAKRFPHAMLATSTHDNKRSEDARARINVISELAAEWKEHIKRWAKINRAKKTGSGRERAPSVNDEYLLYQTLLGCWPLGEPGPDFSTRIENYMLKAAKEAKLATSWTNPDADYEKALVQFSREVIASNNFVADFLPFQKRVAALGMLNSLSQTLLKLSSPGVPDVYQGNEIWDFSLVDPDNRRPVDYSKREAMLGELESFESLGPEQLAERLKDLLANLADGRAKLYLVSRVLNFRQQNPELFKHGDYVPLAAEGPRAGNVIAFARRQEEASLIVVAARFFSQLADENAWGDTVIHCPRGAYLNLLTKARLECNGERLQLDRVLTDFPVTLLVKMFAVSR
ncbi:MAG: malto-oligosyltrehalose synthase [Burkholderiales bacterium]